MSRLILLS